MFEIISAIHFLHTTKMDGHTLFHRDIKSSNIYLQQNYDAKLIDCGLAKFVPVDDSKSNSAIALSVQNASHGGAFGTPGYICPWYNSGKKTFEASCEVYSFGMVMIELVTGCLQNDNKGDFCERYFPGHFEGTPKEALEVAIPKLEKDVDIFTDLEAAWMELNDQKSKQKSYSEVAIKVNML